MPRVKMETVFAKDDGGTPELDVFVFSGFADLTGFSDAELVRGVGDADTDDQASWKTYAVVDMIVGPHWRMLSGVCPSVVIGGYNQVSPKRARAMGFRVLSVYDIALTHERISLSLDVLIRGGLDGQIMTLAYQVTAFGLLATPFHGNPPEGTFYEDGQY